MDRKTWQLAFNKISSKHFDYILCSTDTLAPVAVIELDDKSHTSKNTIKRDRLIERACKSADLKLIRFKVKRNYRVEDVREQIEASLNPLVEIETVNK